MLFESSSQTLQSIVAHLIAYILLLLETSKRNAAHTFSKDKDFKTINQTYKAYTHTHQSIHALQRMCSYRFYCIPM